MFCNFLETIVNLCLLGLVLFLMMYAALDHFMESSAIYKLILILLLSRLIYKKKIAIICP